MSIFDKFEHRVEDVVGGIFAKIGAKNLKPVDLIVALQNEMDKSAVEVRNGKQVVSNTYKLTLSEFDFNKLESWGGQDFADEIKLSLEDHKNSENYSTLGEIAVSFDENLDNSAGVYQISSEAVRDTDDSSSEFFDDILQNDSHRDLQGNGALFSAGDSINSKVLVNDEIQVKNANTNSEDIYNYNSILIDNMQYFLTKPVVVIGRGSTSDITIDDSSMSRNHMEIRISGDKVIATDLQSTNGIFIDGNKTKAASLADGSVISLGKTVITFRAKQKNPNEIIDDSNKTVILNRENINDETQNSAPSNQNNNSSTKKNFFATRDITPIIDGLDNVQNDLQNDSQNNAEPKNSNIRETAKGPDPFDELGLSQPIDRNSASKSNN